MKFCVCEDLTCCYNDPERPNACMMVEPLKYCKGYQEFMERADEIAWQKACE